MSEAFEEIKKGLEDGVRFAKGDKTAGTLVVVLTPEDIREIRANTGLSQAAFAREFQLSPETIKGWEQGKRRPDAAATNFLRLIRAQPETVKEVLRA